MSRVALLAHVKESTLPEPPAASSSSSAAPRIAWHGGAIKSNKEEALRKFYERKMQAIAATGDPSRRSARGESPAFTPHQWRAMQATFGVVTANGETRLLPPPNVPATGDHGRAGQRASTPQKKNQRQERGNQKKPVSGARTRARSVKHSVHAQHTTVVRGRVLGPPVVSGAVVKPSTMASTRTKLSKAKPRSRKPDAVVMAAPASSATAAATSLALQDQLGMSLDALVKRRR